MHLLPLIGSDIGRFPARGVKSVPRGSRPRLTGADGRCWGDCPDDKATLKKKKTFPVSRVGKKKKSQSGGRFFLLKIGIQKGPVGPF